MVIKRGLRYLRCCFDKEFNQIAKAQQNKIKIVTNTNNLPPDEQYVRRIHINKQVPIRKYMVDDELRNAINLKDITQGKMTVDMSPSKSLHFSIGICKGDKSQGNLKLYAGKKLILDKDASNLLNGWNEYQISFPQKKQIVNIEWKNTIRNNVYLSFPYIATVERKRKKNIVVIVIDGIYCNTLGLYDDNPDKDNISKYFKDSILFRNVYAQSDWTLPNFVSIATGLYISHHGVCDPDLYSIEIPHNINTLAEILQNNGFNTFGYVSHNRVSPGYGHARGYNRFIFRCTYDEHVWKPKYKKDVKITDIRKKGNDSKDITFNAIKFLKENQDTDNFLFLHYFDTHLPYFQSPANISNADDSIGNRNVNDLWKKDELDEYEIQFVQEIYRQKFKEVDNNLMYLFDYIEKYEQGCTTVLLTSDHGVALFDEGISDIKKPNLTESTTKIPLLIKMPNGKQEEITDFVEGNITILPTVLDIAQVNKPMDRDGVTVMKSKGYVITELCYKEEYEFFLKTPEFSYHLKRKRDREMDESDIDRVIENISLKGVMEN